MYRSNYKKGSYNKGFVAPRVANQIANVAASQAVRRANYISNNRYYNNPRAALSTYRANRGIKSEIKTVDAACATSFSSDGTVAQTMQLLNTIAQDASPTGRIGKKVLLKSLAIRGTISVANTLNCGKVAMLLVYVRNNNQAATLPAWTEIMVAQNANALTNRDNASKFKILRRWDFKTIGDSDATPPTSESIQIVEEFVKFKKPLEACWTAAGTAGTIGQFEKGSLLLMTCGAVGQGSGPATFVGNTRCYFNDA